MMIKQLFHYSAVLFAVTLEEAAVLAALTFAPLVAVKKRRIFIKNQISQKQDCLLQGQAQLD